MPLYKFKEIFMQKRPDVREKNEWAVSLDRSPSNLKVSASRFFDEITVSVVDGDSCTTKLTVNILDGYISELTRIA